MGREEGERERERGKGRKRGLSGLARARLPEREGKNAGKRA